MIDRHISRGAISIVLAVCISFSTATLATSRNKLDIVPQRILFIGNSYTDAIKKPLLQMLKNSQYKQTTFEFITKGGATLEKHIRDTNTLKFIQTGNWDYVVLQDQSQTPALVGKPEQSFHTSVDILSKLIKSTGAQPVLYMTWGRRDGDMRKKFPDYESMQKKLTRAYSSSAKRNRASLAPVGQAWSVVRQKDKALGNELFRSDGSHPSPKGAYLASCVFFRVLFNDSLRSLKREDLLTQYEWQIIKDAALSIDIPHNKKDAGDGK